MSRLVPLPSLGQVSCLPDLQICVFRVCRPRKRAKEDNEIRGQCDLLNGRDRKIGDDFNRLCRLDFLLCSFLFFFVAHQILRMFPWASDSQINNDYEKLFKNEEKPLEKSGAVCQDRKSRK